MGIPKSNAEYARIITILTANGGVYVCDKLDLTVNEAIVQYTKHVNSYYADENGKPSKSAENIKFVLTYLKQYFGSTMLDDFGPPELKAIRSVMVEEKRARKSINKYVVIIRQFFRWCVEEQLIEPNVLEALRAVKALNIGRHGVVESAPREPANPVDVEKTIPHHPPMVQAVIRLLRLRASPKTWVAY